MALVNGSDHLTAYNLFAEAVNQCGSIGEVYGLPRHVFVEEELAAWAERCGVLVKAIEDTALGTASVYRALEQPLPRACRTHRRRSGGNGSSSSPASCRSTSSSTSARRTARSAHLQDIGGRQLGRRGGHPPLLRRPVRCPARRHRGTTIRTTW